MVRTDPGVAIMAAEEDDPSRHLTIAECQLLADSISEDAAALPDGPKKEDLLKLAQGYRNLANMKVFVERNTN